MDRPKLNNQRRSRRRSDAYDVPPYVGMRRRQAATVDVLAGGFTVGFGINLSASIGPVTFDDKNTSVDPFVFQGPAKFLGAGATLGGDDPSIPRAPWQKRGFSVGFSEIQLGDATSFGPSFQDKIGLEFSLSGGAGISFVRAVKWDTCCGQ